jgi:hypothetical protein
LQRPSLPVTMNVNQSTAITVAQTNSAEIGIPEEACWKERFLKWCSARKPIIDWGSGIANKTVQE